MIEREATGDDHKARLVSNLLVVLCSEQHVQPVLNIGTGGAEESVEDPLDPDLRHPGHQVVDVLPGDGLEGAPFVGL